MPCTTVEKNIKVIDDESHEFEYLFDLSALLGVYMSNLELEREREFF